MTICREVVLGVCGAAGELITINNKGDGCERGRKTEDSWERETGVTAHNGFEHGCFSFEGSRVRSFYIRHDINICALRLDSFGH